MIRALSPEGIAVLHGVAALRPLVALDFDGTLAPIVDDPGAASMRDGTASLLRLIANAYPCAVISGRARADLMTRIGDAPVVAIVGNHGIEVDGAPRSPSVRARVRAWAAALRHALRHHTYIVVEDKGLTVAIHYRAAPSPELAQHRVLSLASALPGAKVFGGHAVVNVVPAESPTKGDALTTLAARLGTHAVVYIGDDETDEDAFRAPVVTLPIRVGHSPGSAARLFLQNQSEVDALLGHFLDAHPDAAPKSAALHRFDGGTE